MKYKYNFKLKKYARELRKNSTKSEIKLWNYLKNRKMLGYKFNRQKPIGNYIVDFFSFKLNLVIELDGYSHEFKGAYEKDLIKIKYLQKQGLSVLRFDDRDVMNDMNNVLREIETYILKFEQENPPAPFKKGERQSPNLKKGTREF